MDFTVTALIAARNEADIISQVIEDLIRQEVRVYLIDDGSTDETVQAASRWLGHGLLEIERRPTRPEFDWTGLLARKQELAITLDGDWFIHHDADEFRESPWSHLNLREAIRQVDGLGYNAIDFRVLNFRPTEDGSSTEEDVRSALRFYEPADQWDTIQVKAWKRQPAAVDLTSFGGHDAVFDGRRVFPVQFLCRHYPIRGQAHGIRKIFTERQPRFVLAELERGWHRQYRDVTPNQVFIRDSSLLREFDPAEVRLELQVKHRDTFKAAEADAHVARLQARLAELTAETDIEREHLQAAVVNVRRTLEAETAEVERLQRLLTSEREETEVRLRAAEAESLRQQAASASRRLSDELTIQGLKTELHALYASKSWWVTRPLRAVYGALTGQPASQSEHQGAVEGTHLALDWGEFARMSPISEVWGIDRGLPVDRYYIDSFLNEHRADVTGHVLEVKDRGYTTQLGVGVTRSSVLDVDSGNPRATIVGDLAGTDLDIDPVDCFILTQTIHVIYDVRSALRQAVHVLKPGGVLLCTLPAVSRVNYEDGGLERGDFWRFTRAAVQRLVEELPGIAEFDIRTWGNVRTCTAFLYGLAAEELPRDVLEYHDPWFPLIHGVRVVKRT